MTLLTGRVDATAGIDRGLLKEVTEGEGTGLVGDHAAGATVLQVASSSFRAEGTCRVAGVEYAYVRAVDSDSLTITPGLAAAADDGEPVESLTPAGATESGLVAVIDLDCDGDSNDVRAAIPGELAGFYRSGTVDAGAIVSVRDVPYGYEVVGRPLDAPGFGGLIETSAEANTGIKISDAGLVGYDESGVARTVIDPLTGQISVIDGTLEGGSIIGGAISIAQTGATAFNEAFSGTTFPAGWTNTKHVGTLADVRASVVSSGPTGQSGSAILVDFGAGGAGGTNTDAGEVSTPIADAMNVEARIRFQVAAPRAAGEYASLTEEVGLGIRLVDTWGLADTVPYESDGIVLRLIPIDIGGGSWAFQVIRGARFQEAAGATELGKVLHSQLEANPFGRWIRAALRIDGGAAYIKVWPDGEAEPSTWFPFVNSTLPNGPGRVAVPWEQDLDWTGAPSRGLQKVWIDEFSVETFATGFQVLPDGTGSWPAIGLAPGDTAWHTVGAAGEPAFENGWTAVTGENVQFRKSPTGDVTIRGRLNGTSATSGTTAFTLPDGYEPGVDLVGIAAVSGASTVLAAAAVDIRAGGAVQFRYNSGASICSLGAVSFSSL